MVRAVNYRPCGHRRDSALKQTIEKEERERKEREEKDRREKEERERRGQAPVGHTTEFQGVLSVMTFECIF